MPFLHADDGGHRQLVDLDASRRTRAGRDTRRRLRRRCLLMPFTIGRPSAYATRTPTWNPPESADSLPNRIRSNATVGRFDLRRSLRRSPRRCAAGPSRYRLIGSSTALLHAEARRVAELLLGFGRAEREDGRRRRRASR